VGEARQLGISEHGAGAFDGVDVAEHLADALGVARVVFKFQKHLLQVREQLRSFFLEQRGGVHAHRAPSISLAPPSGGFPASSGSPQNTA